MVQEIKLAHPLKVKAIASAKIKTDTIDAETLAELLKANLIPEAHLRGEENRRQLQVVRQRAFLVAMRTRVKNRIHVLIDHQRPEIRNSAHRFSDLFGKGGTAWLRSLRLAATDQQLLDQQLELFDQLTDLINETQRLILEMFNHNTDAQLIRTIPGFGRFLSVLIALEIDGSLNSNQQSILPLTQVLCHQRTARGDIPTMGE